MKNLNMNSTRIATIVLAVLLVSSTFMILSNGQTQTYQAISPITQSPVSQRVNPQTGVAYGDLGQYEWPTYGADGSNTRYSAGPSPNAPVSLWNGSIPVGTNANGAPASMVTAFDGMIFFYSASNLVALNATTGSVVWQSPLNAQTQGLGSLLGTAALVKINDNYSASIGSQFITIYSQTNGTTPATTTAIGAIAGTYGIASIGGVYQTNSMWQVVYDPLNQTLISTAQSFVTGSYLGVAISLAQPSSGAVQNGTVAWTWVAPVGVQALCIGGGNAYFGSFNTGQIFAVSMASGSQIWTTTLPGGTAGGSATYTNGVLYHDSGSGIISALNAATGGTLASFKASGPTATYAFGSAAAYGRIFDKTMQIPQSSVGSWSASSLTQQWRQPANYAAGNLVGAVADRKFFITQSELSTGPLPGGFGSFSGTSFACYDAFTGTRLWTLPYAVIAPIVAYGRLYIIALANDGNYYVMCYGDLELLPIAATQGTLTQDWTYFHGGLSSNGNATGASIGNYPSKITTATWTFQADNPISGSQTVAQGCVYFGTWAGTLYCVNAYNGAKVWSQHYNCRILSEPTYDQGMIFTGADDGSVHCLNATTGTEIWETLAGGISIHPPESTAWQVESSSMVGMGKVFTPANDGNLYCFDEKTGNLLWENATSSLVNGNGGSCSRIYTDDYGRTGFVLDENAQMKHIDVNGTTDITIALGTAKATTGTPTIVGDYLFWTYGSGAGTLGVRNASTLNAINTFTLGLGTGASTPMTQTPTYVKSVLCYFANKTNIGYTGAPYTINNTLINGVLTNQTVHVDCVYVAEGLYADSVAFFYGGENIGGNTPQTQWIVNVTTPYFVRVWGLWAGHQVFASASVAINPYLSADSPIDYLGNAAYGFTAFNGSDGVVLSTFTATAQVFSTAALWNDKVYITANDGILYCFSGQNVVTPTITATSNQGTQMALNTPATITGQLTTTQSYTSNLTGDNLIYTPGVPFAHVSLTWVNPNNTGSTTLVTTTDASGNFNFTYTPTVQGVNQWVAYFTGATPTDYLSLNQIYTAYSNVQVGPNVTVTPTPTVIPTSSAPSGTTLNTTDYYAIAAVIVVLVVIIAAVMLLRRRKK